MYTPKNLLASRIENPRIEAMIVIRERVIHVVDGEGRSLLETWRKFVQR
jgi:hypothetical protein